MKILNRYTGEVIIERDVSTIKELVKIAISNSISLSKADLRGADLNRVNLIGVNLSEADLRGANLRGAYLRGANLYKADLSGANLYKADLSEANLYKANLRGAYLYKANLSGADISGINLLCLGNMKEIKTMQIDTYMVGFTKDTLQIGCRSYSIVEWKNFKDEDIDKMDDGALVWWNKWKDFIFKAIELSFDK